MSNSMGMLIGHDTSHWENKGDFTRIKHNVDVVVDYLLLSTHAMHMYKASWLVHGSWSWAIMHYILTYLG
eukprot:c6098_g1_i1 orf=104-313(+)